MVCFNVSDAKYTQLIIEMAMEKLREYQVSISGALLLSGTRLEELEIMDRHYGYINKLSKQASKSAPEFLSVNQGYRIIVGQVLGRRRVPWAYEWLNADAINAPILWWNARLAQRRRGDAYRQGRPAKSEATPPDSRTMTVDAAASHGDNRTWK